MSCHVHISHLPESEAPQLDIPFCMFLLHGLGVGIVVLRMCSAKTFGL